MKREAKTLRVLTLSDEVVQSIQSPAVRERFGDVDIVIGCGDLPHEYLEYVVSVLNKPLFFVRGNHTCVVEYSEAGERALVHGGVNLHRRVVNYRGWLMAGVEGSVRYNRGMFQYTQMEMWGHVLRLVPALLRNRIRYGRYLDVFVTHAPPWGIHDQPDPAHRGIKAFRWFVRAFRPAVHFHGHSHVYRSGTTTETQFHATRVINTYPYRETEVGHPTTRLALPWLAGGRQKRGTR